MNRGRKVIEVAAGLIVREGRLLIAQRLAHDSLGGLWEFPGGKREAGESFETCLARELREELDIETSVGAFVEEIRHDYPRRSVLLRFFKCAWISGEPRPLACAALEWITPEQLCRYEFPAADQTLVERLENEPELWR